MAEIITGFFQGKTSNDSAIAGQIDTNGGLSLDIALLSDLVTPQGYHLQLPQLAIDSVLASIQNSMEQDVAFILYRAIQHANEIIHLETTEVEGAACSLVLVAVQNGETLYVAHVGNSRAYLVRKEKISQLTIDHTFALMMPIQDKMSHSAARMAAEAESLVLSIGPKEQIPADIGLHNAQTIDKDSYLAAQTRGQAGLQLEPNDTIILATNRLEIDDNTSSFDISQALYKKIGDEAAESVAKISDDVEADSSVSLIQFDAPALRLEPIAFEFLGQPAFLRSSVIAMLVVLFSIASFMGSRYLEMRPDTPQTDIVRIEENEVGLIDEVQPQAQTPDPIPLFSESILLPTWGRSE